GRFNKDSVGFHARYDGIKEAMLETCEELGVKTYQDRHKKSTIYLLGTKDIPYVEYIENKEIPECVYRLDKEHLAFFLGSIFSAGGWFFAGRICEIGYATKKQNLALNLKHLLLRFGIRTHLLQKTMKDTT